MVAAPQGPLVDCHAHVWGRDMPFAPGAWTRPDYVYTAEDFQADMARHGIGHGVIAAASLFGTHNGYTLDSLRRFPNLRGTAILEPGTGSHALAALRAQGIVGVRLQWYMVEPLPDAAAEPWRGFCHRLRDLAMHVQLNIDGPRLAAVARALLDSGVRVVIDHFGWHDPAPRLRAPSYRQMLELLEADNAWVKLSGGFRRPDRDLPAEYTRDLLRRFGPGKLLWGSDSPFVGHEKGTSYAQVVEDLHYAVPDAVTRAALGHAAWQFYFAEPAHA